MKLSLQSWPLLILIFFFLASLYINRYAFTREFNFHQIDFIYNHSQFAPDPANRLFVIQDWELYPYAGYHYLTTGDLNTVNIEHPPLGKYLLGISILLFKNTAWVQSLLALCLICCVYAVSSHFLKNKWLGVLVSVLFMQEELFAFNLTHGMLDQLFATLLAVYFVLLIKLPLQRLNSTLWVGIVLGLLASTKFPPPVLIFVVLYAGFQFLTLKTVAIKHLMLLCLMIATVYLATYIPMLYQDGLMGVFTIHLQALRIHLGHVPEYPILAPLRLMITNQWRIWWIPGQLYKPTTEWNLFWPALAGAALFSPIWMFKRFTRPTPMLLIILSTFLYFVFINTRLFFPHYLYPLLPWLYLLLVISVQKTASFINLYIRYA